MQVSGCGGYCAVHLSCKKNLSKPATASMASSGSDCAAVGAGERLICVELTVPPSQPRAARQRKANAPCRSCRVEPSRRPVIVSCVSFVTAVLPEQLHHANGPGGHRPRQRRT